MRKKLGFTLAELLITIGILGVVATFTIPKVLQVHQDNHFNTIAKETAAMVTEAYYNRKLNNDVSTGTTLGVLLPFINYVRVETTVTLDNVPGQPSYSCSDVVLSCLRLHNGAVLVYNNTVSFGGTASTNGVFFQVDPDGKYTGIAGQESIEFWLYYPGRLSTYGKGLPMTRSSGFINPCPTCDPAWFN